ncbi:hypothetical protein PoB_005562500 [Plakobranchus ocellatus]|uniref:Uncharacterized protein n=1 Tax=Plakobranchus ocellatus TaxID=259542 RepID=A0AAV4CBS8_9GAST|nr:hypothetical protein PoB_005562500 [Plakobranchus ocellatus]
MVPGLTSFCMNWSIHYSRDPAFRPVTIDPQPTSSMTSFGESSSCVHAAVNLADVDKTIVGPDLYNTKTAPTTTDGSYRSCLQFKPGPNSGRRQSAPEPDWGGDKDSLTPEETSGISRRFYTQGLEASHS